MSNYRPAALRFFEKVDRSGGPDACHLWQAAIYKGQGYGKFGWNYRSEYAHRAAWLLAGKVIPAGMCVLHRCDNRLCVNVRHLFLGTKKDNTLDMILKGRSAFQTRPEMLKHYGNRFAARLSDEHIREICKKYVAGSHTRAMLAEKYSVSAVTISRILKAHHISSSRYHKLTDYQVLEVRLLVTNGKSHREVAERFGVSKSAIGYIVKGKRRRYATV